MVKASPANHLFEHYGVELEYMIVNRTTQSVSPICDRLLHAIAGKYVGEVENGQSCWSNELVLHVVELKTNGPVNTLEQVPELFHTQIQTINRLLGPMDGRLMPTGMHPWMDPARETQLWPHEGSSIYQTFNKIFDCRRHGWANLQSVHLNLPFNNEAEFARLHAAIRLVLPIIPALAASSPLLGGRLTGLLDNRVDVYRDNCERVPSITGRVIPEAIFGIEEYKSLVLQKIYRELRPLDSEGVLCHEWINARGAIARFDRNTIEIRLIDMQECPLADLAICAVLIGVIQNLVHERWSNFESQKAWREVPLQQILQNTTAEADQALIDDKQYLQMFGFKEHRCRAAELWNHLIESCALNCGLWQPALKVILQRGTLARRIVEALSGDHSSSAVKKIYTRLCDCLSDGKFFV